MVLTSWMSARLVRDREVQQLDRPLMPTATKNLIGALANPSWDPGRRYSMPWQAGLTGIAYDATKVDRAIGSINELLTRKDLAGRVSLLTEFNDTVGAAALAGGADLTDLTVGRCREGARPDRGGQQLRTGPPLLRQRVHQGAEVRHHRRLPRLVGRRAAGPADQPEHQVRGARGRAC